MIVITEDRLGRQTLEKAGCEGGCETRSIAIGLECASPLSPGEGTQFFTILLDGADEVSIGAFEDQEMGVLFLHLHEAR